MKVLIIQQKMIGDVLTSTILCENIKKRLPNSKVHYLINSNTQAVVEHNTHIDKVVLFTKEYRNSKLAFFTFLKAIRKEKYDVVIDVYGKLESNLITVFSKAPITISYSKWYSKFIFTHVFEYTKTGDFNTGLAIENRLKLLTPIFPKGKEALLSKPKIYLSSEEISKAKLFLQKHNVNFSKPILMINALGSGKAKTYPLAYMAQVVDTISNNSEATLLFNYTPEQSKEAQELYSLCNEKTRNQIKFKVYAPSLRSFLALLSQCNALIGNEGGAVNMAKAVRVPTFSIFSPWITKASWDIFKDENNVAVHLNDFIPEKIKGKSRKALKKESLALYFFLKPSLFSNKLKDFLSLKVGPNK